MRATRGWEQLGYGLIATREHEDIKSPAQPPLLQDGLRAKTGLIGYWRKRGWSDLSTISPLTLAFRLAIWRGDRRGELRRRANKPR